MDHAVLVDAAVSWLRSQRCGVVLSEQGCSSGEMPDAIGWKGKCHSIVVECKVSRGDFLTDAAKAWRTDVAIALGCERYYMAQRGMIRESELPLGWGLIEFHSYKTKVLKKSKRNLRQDEGFKNEMNLLLASLARVEVRIEPRRITEFLKWKNRMAKYNGGEAPEGVSLDELNPHLLEPR
jgi:hypothetical protein